LRIVELVRSAYQVLVDLCLDAASRGTETHAYLLGRVTLREIIITTVLRAGTPVERAAMTQPDYAAAALAMQPYLARGEMLRGEVHRHPTGYRGPSPGDQRMLLAIPPEKFPGYLCMVITDMPDGPPVITAHSVENGEIVEHEVRIIENAYPVLLPATTGDVTVLSFGAGSGAAASTPQVAKLPVGAVTIVDHDRIEARNLPRHIADYHALGKSKAKYLARFLRTRSQAHIASVELEITPATTEELDRLVASHTFAINNTGHPPTSILLSRSCANARKVCIHAGAFARGSGGFVFLQTPDGPCYERGAAPRWTAGSAPHRGGRRPHPRRDDRLVVPPRGRILLHGTTRTGTGPFQQSRHPRLPPQEAAIATVSLLDFRTT
jgi:hypothetical protein